MRRRSTRRAAAGAGAVRAAGRQQPEHGAARRRRPRRGAPAARAACAEDEVIVAPFSRRSCSVTGPTTRSRHGPRRHRRHQAVAAAPRFSTRCRRRPRARRRARAARAIVLITDGYDEHSTSRFDDDDRARCADSNVTLYVIGIGGVAGISLKGEKLLTQLAAATGGRAWFPRDERSCSRRYEPVAAGRPAPLPAHLHADEPAAGRHLASDHGQAPDAGARRSAPARATPRRWRRRSAPRSSSPPSAGADARCR